MQSDRELMQQALEALEPDWELAEWYVEELQNKAIKALRERLAQPEPQAPRPDYRDWDYQDQLDAQEKPEQSPLDRMAENARELGLDYEPVQEPVAWVTGWHDGHCVIRAANPAAILPIGIALYTTPPRREWVGLTEEEAFACRGRDYFETYRAIETKLREKNSAQ